MELHPDARAPLRAWPRSSILSTSGRRIGVGLPAEPMKSPTPVVPLIRNQASRRWGRRRRLHLDEDVAGVQLAFEDLLLAGADGLSAPSAPGSGRSARQALDLDLALQSFPDLHLSLEATRKTYQYIATPLVSFRPTSLLATPATTLSLEKTLCFDHAILRSAASVHRAAAGRSYGLPRRSIST